ncbi:acyl-CoA carboxylase subunit beta [Desulfogranum marinum]|uniref:acyl-CoA carboxylase subunit beta n=1 Tax=Desulfogranum marinum TaxID=453220 RepID=UPI0019624E2C|nr:acyl-CoA carboxylase subunit beta [Desulfogranum marinum]MBM9511143.1 acyl-CoA carboxylase subunit beta [Desulfogranum marinum]
MAIDPTLLEKLNRRRQAAFEGGGKAKLAKMKEKGLLTARQRLDILFDTNSFQELGMHAKSSARGFGMEKKNLPGDGVVTGIGYVDGRQVAAYAQDFTVSGGSLGHTHAKKICHLMDYAMKAGIPVVCVNDSGGARIQEGVQALSGYGQIFFRNVQASGLIPQISVIAGSCAGGAAYSPALTDFLIMTRENSNMFICGPQVIQSATGEKAELEQFASAAAHASVSGNIHLVAENDHHALELSKALLSYLPLNNIDEPPHQLAEQIILEEEEGFNELIPEDPKMAFDVLKVIDLLVDRGSFFEIMKDFAKNLVIGFARIDGMVVGIVANQPAYKVGCLDIDASDKGARFIRVCNLYQIPIVTLVDVPGFIPGLAQEQGGIIRHGAKMLFSYAAATVPKITLIMRKAYGGAYLAMCSSDLGADLVYAWPTAEIAVMGADGAVKIIYGKELKDAEHPEELMAELNVQYREEFASPYQAAENDLITDVINPASTRGMISLGLRSLYSKRETRPPKKHGNIPL